MIPPIDDLVLQQNPEFAALYTTLTTVILNPDASTRKDPKAKKRAAVRKVPLTPLFVDHVHIGTDPRTRNSTPTGSKQPNITSSSTPSPPPTQQQNNHPLQPKKNHPSSATAQPAPAPNPNP